ncbi:MULTISPECIES: hypothetical protein [Mycobacteroides]|uniref:hypothetical protein n=1 Tax=Mycobacteroides TaxID=670516 RepID=UPI001040A0F8|nr:MULTISPECIES: hypothetical protein [Mycobacteroides]
MSALLGELRGLDKAGSSLASRHRESGASPDTRPAKSPADQHFCPVGTRQCLLSGLFVLGEQHPDAGHRVRRGGNGV